MPRKGSTRGTPPGNGDMDPIFFKHFCDTMPDPVWLKDREGRFLYVNKAMCAKILKCRQPRTALGKTESYFAGKARREGYRYDIDRMSEASDRSVYENQKADNFYEYGFIHNKFYYFEIYKSPLIDGEGKVRGLFGLAKDITAYTAAGEELEKYETQYRSIFENALEGIFQTTGDGKFLSVNPAMARMFGYVTPEEMLKVTGGIQDTFFVSTDQGVEFLRHLERNGLVEDYQVEAYRKDSKKAWIAINAWAVPGPDGSLLCYEGTVENITDRKRSEEITRESEKRFRTLFDFANDAILLIKDYLITDCNKKALEMFACRKEDCMGQRIERLFPERQPDGHSSREVLRRVYKAVLQGEPRYFEWSVKRFKGGLFDAEINLQRVELHDGIVIQAIVKDITDRKRSTEAINNERKRFEMVFREIPFGLALIDAWGTFKYVNQKFVEIFGYTTKDVPNGRTWFRKVYPEASYRNMVVAEWKGDHAFSQPGQRLARIFHVVCKDGTTKIVRFISVRLPTEEFLMTCEDVTQKRIAEEALENSERRLADIVSYLPDPTMVIDRSGVVIAWNRSMEVLTGFPACDIVGKGEYEYAIPFYRQRRPILVDLALTPDDDSIGTRYPFMERDGDTLTTELFVSTFGEEGSYLWARAKPLYDVTGNIIGAIETIRDVTEMKLAEIGIRRSEAKYRALFDESIDVIYISTPDGQLTDINPAGMRLFGYHSKEELLQIDVGKDIYYDEADRAILLEKLDGERFVSAYEINMKRKDGQKVVVSLNAMADIDNEGRVVAYRGTMRDITKLKALEQQLMESQKMETVGRLAGGIAHDFNNMLNVILGNAQLAKMRLPAEGKPHDYVVAIEQAVRKAADFVKQLLAVSRRQMLNTQVVSMNDVIADFSKMVNRVIGENIEMNFIPSVRSTLVKVDVAQINQVLLNLVVNARDSMSKGGVLTIMTSMEKVVEGGELLQADIEPGNYVVLTVSDTGEGIDREVMDHMFEPFFTTKKQGEGTGLGLSVVYGIVKQHGGYVKVKSVRGKGTSFRIYLPAATEAKRAEADEKSVVCGGNETIFVVEDDLVLRGIAADILGALGYTVIVASDGEAAVKLFEEKSGDIDLVLLDVVMPKMEGTEVYRHIKMIRQSTPVLFVTGYSLERIDEKFMKENNAEVLQKPYSLEVLSQKVREILDGRKS